MGRLFIPAVAVGVFVAQVIAAHVEIRVAVNGTDSPVCGLAGSDPCETISFALDFVAVAFENDTVSVKIGPGRFNSSSCGSFLPANSVVAGAGMHATIIDCEGHFRAFTSSGNPGDYVVANLTVVNGFADDNATFGAYGGGILLVLFTDSLDSYIPSSVIVDGVRILDSHVENSVTTAYDIDAYYSSAGGGLMVELLGINSCDDCSIQVVNSEFHNNSVNGLTEEVASIGGNVYLRYRVIVPVDDTHFFVSVANSSFTNGRAVSADKGAQGGGLGIQLGFYSTMEMLHAVISIDGCTFVGNQAYYAGGVYASYNGLLMITNTVIANNTAFVDAGGIYPDLWISDVTFDNVTVLHNVARDQGGGMYLWPGPATPNTTLSDVSPYPVYREWGYMTFVQLNNCVFDGNIVSGPSGCGGGFAMADGGDLAVTNCSFINNFATLFGGGVFLQPASSQLHFHGRTVFKNNRVTRGGGAQLVMMSGGALALDGVSIDLTRSMTQVLTQGAGLVSWSNTTSFQCPAGTLFHDNYGGLYASGAAVSAFPDWTERVLVSTFAFLCTACPQSYYTVGAGWTNGDPAFIKNPLCLPCPFGGNCPVSGAMTAAPGFWGAPVNRTVGGVPVTAVDFLQCPEGYCCAGLSNTSYAPCAAINSCAGNREGRLCGRCKRGYGETIGSSACRRTSECTDGAWFWPLATLGLLAGGCLMLRNGELWCPRKAKPTGKAKLASYFYQMVPLVVIPAASNRSSSTFKQVLEGFFSVFRLQLPGNGSGRGACVIPHMTVPLKLSLGYLIPLLVAVSMAMCYAAGLALGKTRAAQRVRQYFDERQQAQRAKRIAKQASVTRSSEWVTGALNPIRQAAAAPSAATAGAAPDGKTTSTMITPVIEMAPLASPVTHGSASVPLVSATPPPSTATPRKSQLMFWHWKSFRNPLADWDTRDLGGYKDLALSDPAPQHKDLLVLPLMERVKGSAINWLLFAYSSILNATLRLLSCVSVPGVSGTYLLADANRLCSSAAWQGPLFIVVIFVVGFGVLMPVITFRVHRRRIQRRGFYRILCEQYRPECYWWESVLIAQRLVLSFLATFATATPVLRMVLSALVCLCCTVAHLHFRPMNTSQAQQLQTLFQFSLLVVVICNISPAYQLEVADSTTTGGSGTSARLLNTLDLLFIYILPIIAILASVPVQSWVNPIMVLFH